MKIFNKKNKKKSNGDKKDKSGEFKISSIGTIASILKKDPKCCTDPELEIQKIYKNAMIF